MKTFAIVSAFVGLIVGVVIYAATYSPYGSKVAFTNTGEGIITIYSGKCRMKTFRDADITEEVKEYNAKIILFKGNDGTVVEGCVAEKDGVYHMIFVDGDLLRLPVEVFSK